MGRTKKSKVRKANWHLMRYARGKCIICKKTLVPHNVGPNCTSCMKAHEERKKRQKQKGKLAIEGDMA